MLKTTLAVSSFVLGVAVTTMYHQNSFVKPDPPVVVIDRTHTGILPFGQHGPTNDLLKREAYGVAEHLNKASLSNHGPDSDTDDDEDDSDLPSRKHSSFKTDPDIPKLYQSRLADYKDSHFDRFAFESAVADKSGHLASCGNIKSNQLSMDESFLLSNICPQTGSGFNRGYWLQMESFVRGLVRHFDQVYVVSGPLFLPKQYEDGKHYVHYQMIGNPPNTAVPTHFFKVILVEKAGTYSIGSFVVPNESIKSSDPLEGFVVPLESIEHSSGLEFFPGLSRNRTSRLCDKVECAVPGFRHKIRNLLKQSNKE